MTIAITCLGGARTVTGSKHLVTTSRAAVLLDCGLFQGHRAEANRRNREPPPTGALDAVVLSHAHLDHSGALPVLVKRGYGGPIYATPATRDLCAPMLADSASLQEADARHIAKAIARGVDLEPVEPLYTTDDAVRALAQIVGVPYHRPQGIAPGVTLTFLDAGHVLGSAIVVLDLEDGGRRVRLAFTGDLGRAGMPILRDPEVVTGADVLVSESTYGDRLHPPLPQSQDALAAAIARTVARGGKVIVPAFALERAQELLLALAALRARGAIPPIPVYVDSPLATKVTEVFRLHPDCYDRDAADLLRAGPVFEFPGLVHVADVEQSKAIDDEPGSSIIVAGSGMCEGGRVLHHLRALIGDPRTTIALVGYCAEHTLGRRILERRPRVKIFGVLHELHAEVVALEGFSAHADRDGLVAYAAAAAPRTIVLVHGEAPAQDALDAALRARGFADVRVPAAGERVVL